MLLKGFFEVYAEGDTMDELVEAVRALPPAGTLAPYRHASWKVYIYTSQLLSTASAMRLDELIYIA